MSSESIQCSLNEGGTVVFDVTDTSADDHDEMHLLYELFASLFG